MARDMPDRSGRVAVVTGSNTGIGLETAAALARHGARVVIAYYGPDGFGELRGYPTRVGSSSESTDEAVAARLWQVSEDLVGLEFALQAVRRRAGLYFGYENGGLHS